MARGPTARNADSQRYERVEVLRNRRRKFRVYIDPAGTKPAVCIATWKRGVAMINLMTWRHTGDRPPARLRKWLEKNERYLWDQWVLYHF